MRFTVFHVYRSPFLLSGARSLSGALVGVVALTCLPPVPPDFFLRTTSDASSARRLLALRAYSSTRRFVSLSRIRVNPAE